MLLAALLQVHEKIQALPGKVLIRYLQFQLKKVKKIKIISQSTTSFSFFIVTALGQTLIFISVGYRNILRTSLYGSDSFFNI